MIKDKNNIIDSNNRNVFSNDNDNASLNDDVCLKAIPYEQALQQNGWGELKPIGTALLPVEPFKIYLLPTPLINYVYDVADMQQSSIDFVAISALCGLAAVIGNGVRIAPKQHANWTIVPNLWGAIVGQPSTMKTPTMKAALAPLYAFQEEWHQEWIKQKKSQETKDILIELDKREKKKQAYKALKDQDEEQALALLSQSFEHKETDDDDTLNKRRLIVNDVTVEKLGELLKENPRGLLMVRDELSGFLANLERKEYQTDRSFYLTAFNGDDQFTYDRIERGTIFIPNATLSVIGGIQPSRIIPLIQAMHYGINDDGLLQRFQMLVFPDERKERDWVDRPPNQKAWEIYQEVFRSLYDKPLGSPKHPMIMRFSADAQEIFREWWEKFQKTIKGGNFSTNLQSYLLKMDKTIASLALIFELCEGGRFEINRDALERALCWEKYLISHAKRLYAAGDTLTAERAKLIVERCDCLSDVFTLRDVHQKSWSSLKDNQAVKQALELLCRYNYIREIASDHSSKSGRPTIRYEWHPLVKSDKTSQWAI
ncbi:YfjI family protein [Bartonella gabonensis]|uniref:YfjI family protein n=1 Tax=Bartonella gabonensis TaxID=2699889 RepID=UPI001588ED69|nr:YfjI family protein [Bartonella gabonensis]